MADRPITLGGEWRPSPGAAPAPCTVELGAGTFAIVPRTGARIEPMYRDVVSLAAADFALTLQLDGGMTVELLRFGPSLSQLVGTIRERRTRQRLEDRLVRVPSEPLEAVDAAAGPWSGRAYVVPHPWGLVVAPFEPDAAPVAIRRAEIAEVTETTATGSVTVRTTDGGSVELRKLGAHARRHADAARGLAAAAAADAAAIVEATLPAAAFGTRHRLATLLVDGRPAARTELGDAWAEARDAFASAGEVADHLDRLESAAGSGSASWLAVAPVRPGTSEPKAWFFVGFPSGLVAMEVVTPGSHATYCFSVAGDGPDALPSGGVGSTAATGAAGIVAAISNALVDLRFLREPIALPVAALGTGGARDYRRAVAEIASLRTARAHFVGRIVHDDGWDGAVAEADRWVAGGATGEWPGRSRQEARIGSVGEAEDDDAGTTGAEE